MRVRIALLLLLFSTCICRAQSDLLSVWMPNPPNSIDSPPSLALPEFQLWSEGICINTLDVHANIWGSWNNCSVPVSVTGVAPEVEETFEPDSCPVTYYPYGIIATEAFFGYPASGKTILANVWISAYCDPALDAYSGEKYFTCGSGH